MIIETRRYGDCVLAALGTALGVPYEQVAAMLGVRLDGNGLPAINAAGLGFNHLVWPLWRHGIAAVHLISNMHPRVADLPWGVVALPNSNDIRAVLQGRRALISAEYSHDGVRVSDPHTFAWIDDGPVIERFWFEDDGITKSPVTGEVTVGALKEALLLLGRPVT